MDIMSPSRACCFCKTALQNEYTMGKMFTSGKLATHYFCLLLSTNTRQNGEDHEGILGFLLNDIRSEVRRRKSVVCTYCKKKGASIYCASSKCRTVFHLPCGLKRSTHHHFFGSFQSFCERHRPVQKIPTGLRRSDKQPPKCGVCLDFVTPKASPDLIWSPCCDKWHHKECLQKLAHHAGYFFKCPYCNNKHIFEEAAKNCGIFVREQDASWELEPNAYGELLERHSQCDAKICRAKSRNVDVKGQGWELILCKYCGSQGIHRICGNLKMKKPSWQCTVCTPVVTKDSDDDETEENSMNVEEVTMPDAPEVSMAEAAEVSMPDALAMDVAAPVVEEQNATQSSEMTTLESESSFITYNIIEDVEENISVILSSGDSDVEVVNYEPSVRSVDNHKYELKTRSGNYVEVVKLNEAMDNKPVADGDIKVRRSKKVILINDDSDVAIVSEPESEYDC